jgi:hypothetical protein
MAYKAATVGHQFFNGATQAMTLDGSGNLGLGVTPQTWQSSYKAIQVNSQASLSATSSAVYLSNNFYQDAGGTNRYIATGAGGIAGWEANIFRWYQAASGSAGATQTTTNSMTLAASGNLLIGTTTESGSGRLRVVDSVRIADSSTETNALLITTTASAATIETRYATPIVLGVGAVEAARIDSSGNLLVGTTSQIYGNAGNIQSFGSSNFVAGGNSGSATCTALRMINNNSGATVGTITYDSSSTAYNTSSDYRLKNITGPITTSGAYIDSLNPVEGTWKIDGSTFVGLLAHEAQEVSRTKVATGVKDGPDMQGMAYASAEIIANLIAEIQSLRQRVAQLEGKS